MKRVLILTDEEIDILLTWHAVAEGERCSSDGEEDDVALAKKLRGAKLPA